MQRIQKLLSAWGICSRRKAEEAIQAGRVKINGRTAALGDRADPSSDVIELDSKVLTARNVGKTIVLNKPPGCVSTMSDERGRKCVAQLVEDIPERLFPVGRLDMYSEGLLLMTGDGKLANILGHPSGHVEKEYLLRVQNDHSGDYLRLRGPIELDGEMVTAQVSLLAHDGNSTLLRVVITRGLNRQIRRMCEAADMRVLKLKRIREGKIELGMLPSGKWRELTEAEAEYLESLKKREA